MVAAWCSTSSLGRLGLAFAAGPAAVALAAATTASTAPATATAGLLRLDGPLLGRHRVVLHDLALEDPDLHADHAVCGLGEAVAEVDVRAQRVQGHASLAI